MYNKFTASDAEALKKIVGAEHVLVDSEISPDYSHDELGGVHCMPEALVRVRSTEEVSAVMKHAYARKIPVTVRGSGTGLVGSAAVFCSKPRR